MPSSINHKTFAPKMTSAWFVLLLSLCLIISLYTVHANDIFAHRVLDGEGNEVSMEKFRDAKALLIVNVASNCGFTYTNYRELNDLYKRLHSRGLEIVAFPSNQFGEQEPGTNEEIQTFCHNYGVKFPVMAKIDVNGPDAHPLYKFLKNFSEDSSNIGWNFAKFLVVNGYPVKRYAPRINPKKIEADILLYLDEEERGL